METMDAIRRRHSVRLFGPAPLLDEQIERLIEAAAAAPSACNSQPWRFHVATGMVRDRVNEIMALSTVHLSEYVEILGPEGFEHAQEFYANLGHAPIVIACSLPSANTELDRINGYVSVGAAIENMLLAATDMGLGSCNITFSFWVRDQLRETFEVPDGREVVSLILIGHPAETPAAPRHRQDIATILE